MVRLRLLNQVFSRIYADIYKSIALLEIEVSFSSNLLGWYIHPMNLNQYSWGVGSWELRFFFETPWFRFELIQVEQLKSQWGNLRIAIGWLLLRFVLCLHSRSKMMVKFYIHLVLMRTWCIMYCSTLCSNMYMKVFSQVQGLLVRKENRLIICQLGRMVRGKCYFCLGFIWNHLNMNPNSKKIS